jgi:hypothetical protein
MQPTIFAVSTIELFVLVGQYDLVVKVFHKGMLSSYPVFYTKASAAAAAYTNSNYPREIRRN